MFWFSEINFKKILRIIKAKSIASFIQKNKNEEQETLTS